MSKTISNIALFLLVIFTFKFLSLLPIYPLLVEGREISSEGESLYQDWILVSLGGYFDYAYFANSAWLDSTQRSYFVLLFIYTLVLFSVSASFARWLVKLLFRKMAKGNLH